MNKKILTLSILTVGLLVFWVGYRYYGYTPKDIISNNTEPEFKEVTKYNAGINGYTCSKPIKVRRQRTLVDHRGGSAWEDLYLPVNAEEAKLLCHISSSE